jgi:uncharacterized protein (UPF0276 family)
MLRTIMREKAVLFICFLGGEQSSTLSAIRARIPVRLIGLTTERGGEMSEHRDSKDR